MKVNACCSDYFVQVPLDTFLLLLTKLIRSYISTFNSRPSRIILHAERIQICEIPLPPRPHSMLAIQLPSRVIKYNILSSYSSHESDHNHASMPSLMVYAISCSTCCSSLRIFRHQAFLRIAYLIQICLAFSSTLVHVHFGAKEDFYHLIICVLPSLQKNNLLFS